MPQLTAPCVVCRQPAVLPRQVCLECWKRLHAPGVPEELEARQKSKVEALKVLRRTMTDGERASRILRDHGVIPMEVQGQGR